MGETRVSKVEEKAKSFLCELKCNDCELIVRLTSERELTDEQRDELQERIVCTPCEKRRLNAKK